MRIQNNITAMNTHRMYTSNNSAISKSAEKLSSGYRINRAGDDAAGLAISEKMRSQIRGLNMASKNSQDANSLIQTAEGALQEVHSMLQRMNELANQSATGTNENFDRTQISAEFDQLKSEINDISEQTNFNNMKLLDGSLASGAAKVTVDSDSGLAVGKTFDQYTITGQSGLSSQKGTYSIAVNADNTNAIDITFNEQNDAGTATGNVTKTTINLVQATSGNFAKGGAFTLDLSEAGMGTFEMTASATAGATASDLAAKLAAVTGALTTEAATSTSDFTSDANVSAYTGSNSAPAGTYTLSATGTALTVTDANGNVATAPALAVGGTEIDLSALAFSDGTTVDLGKFTKTEIATAAQQVTALDGTTITAPDNGGNGKGGLKIQVGANEGEQLTISVEKMNVEGLGLSKASIANQEDAGKAITSTQGAINMVSEQRATLGAMQNRLEHKISNLDNTSENLSASESRIRDVDIAKEMTSFTKNQILSQAATAMLAQANSMPQNVLSLLQ